MAFTYDDLVKFVTDNGDVSLVDTTGKAWTFSGEPDLFQLIEKADRFKVQGRWVNRQTFEQLVADNNAEGKVVKVPPPSGT